MESNHFDIPWMLIPSVQIIANVLVLSLPTFFVLKWLIKRTKIQPRHRLVVTFVSTIIVAPLIYAAFVGLVLYIISYQPRENFNASTWRTDPERYQMADDLIEQKILEGKDSLYVKELLGSPTRRTNSTNFAEPRNLWIYEMGMGTWGFGVKFHTLAVKYDRDRVLTVTRGGSTDYQIKQLNFTSH